MDIITPEEAAMLLQRDDVDSFTMDEWGDTVPEIYTIDPDALDLIRAKVKEVHKLAELAGLPIAILMAVQRTAEEEHGEFSFHFGGAARAPGLLLKVNALVDNLSEDFREVFLLEIKRNGMIPFQQPIESDSKNEKLN